MASASKISFTVRPPSFNRTTSSGTKSEDARFKTPSFPRRLANESAPGSPLARSTEASPRTSKRRLSQKEHDSSDEEEEPTDELVTGFDKFGVQRLHEKPKPSGPLVIPAIQNRDWREFAKKRRSANRFAPGTGQVGTGADGSVGGLGTRDVINSGPALSGLQLKKKLLEDVEMGSKADEDIAMESAATKHEEETEDQKAIRLLLAGGDDSSETHIDVIPISETEALRQDVEDLPDEATLADYERVPIEQFGAALLRGMGWKEGTSASRKGKGIIEPYLPTARPALLGIGAKEQEVYDDGSKPGKSKGAKRPERRYVPVMKQQKQRDSNEEPPSRNADVRRHSPGRSSSSRRYSRSPHRESSRRRDDERQHNRDRGRDRDYARRGDNGTEKDARGDRDYDDSKRSDRDYEDDRRRYRSYEGKKRRDGEERYHDDYKDMSSRRERDLGRSRGSSSKRRD